MLEFLQTNAWWIVVACLFVLMMRMHGAGGGMDHGAHRHEPERDEVQPGQERMSLAEPSDQERPAEAEDKEKQPVARDSRHSGGCC